MEQTRKAKVRELVGQLDHSNTHKQAEAAYNLAMLGHKSSLGRVVEILNTDGVPNRYFIARNLGRSKDKRVFPHLVNALSHPQTSIREGAATGLGLYGSKQATPHLIKLLTDSHYSVRNAATFSLARLRDPSAFGELEKILKTRNHEQKVIALAALGHLGSKKSMKLFEEALPTLSKSARRRLRLHLEVLNTDNADRPLLLIYLENNFPKYACDRITSLHSRLAGVKISPKDPLLFAAKLIDLEQRPKEFLNLLEALKNPTFKNRDESYWLTYAKQLTATKAHLK